MKLAAGLIVLSVVALWASAIRVRYEGDQVLLFPDQEPATWNRIIAVLRQHIPVQELDIWKTPVFDQPGYVRIPSRYLTAVLDSLRAENIRFTVSVENVENLVAASESAELPTRRGAKHPIVGTFPRYDEIVAWMSDLVAEYPEIASTFSIGSTYEGRPMQVLQLGAGSGNKWKMWLDAGMHAREWIAPTTAIYIIDQLVHGWENNDPEIVSFLETLEFHFLPSANPDGYEYSHTTDRMWRKNRKPDSASGCVGVDLNRNFNFHWGEVTAEPDPCDTFFMGESPESEVEVQNIVNHIMSQSTSYVWYHSYHSWGELFFTRWDYTGDEVPPDHDELLSLAHEAVDAINAVHSEYYLAGTAPDLMYPFSGSSSDWSRGVAQIKYPFLQELRDHNGTYAFVPPPSEIIPCGEENWAGFLVVLREVMANYGGVQPPSAS